MQSKARIALISLAALAVGVGYAVLAKPVYQANLLIKLEGADQAAKGIPQSLSAILDLRAAASSEVELLKSRAVIGKVVENLQLDVIVEPKRLPIIGQWVARDETLLSQPGLFGLGGYAWGNESISVQRLNVPDRLLKKPIFLTVRDAGSFSIERKGVAPAVGSIGSVVQLQTPEGLIEVKVDALRANPGVQFRLVRIPFADAIEELQRNLVVTEQGRQSGMIAVSLKDSKPDVAANVLNEVGHQYIALNVNLKSQEAEKSLRFLEGQLPALKAAIDAAETKYKQYRSMRGTADLAEETRSTLQQSVQAQMSLLELRKTRSELISRYQPENPIVRSVDQQIATVMSELRSIDEKMRSIPDTEQELATLTREVNVNTTLYAALLQSVQQLRIAQASQVGSAKLIDRAIRPATAVGPKRLLIAGAAVAAGFFLGVLSALFRRQPAAVLVHQDELPNGLGAPIRGLIPFSQAQVRLGGQVMSHTKRINVLAEAKTQDGAIECLRTFCTALQFSMLHARNNVVAIVGPTSGVGKSFIAANVAAILASSGKRVLLIDADLRGGHLHRYFGVERAAGLAEVVMQGADLGQVMHANVLPRLDFMTTGGLLERPADALANGRLAALLHGAEAVYDCILIDTPPVLAVADSLVVARSAGLVFCVVRKNESTSEQVKESELRFASIGIPIAGLIFNGAKSSDVAYGYRTERRVAVDGAALGRAGAL